ncbi:MAG: methionyl-tRNA formyltransferase [Bacteroidetes bacterium]|nr:methionyl-tRNA formyltransferase [Bacteroidota bacterium]MBU2585434.1 methionyl-tRNA formyltransferase [Bacteroidota bacterium]
MKIVFFGTPDFAAICLQKLINNEYNIVSVVTVPDKQKGRGQKKSFSPVKEIALHSNIPILQPENLKDELFISQLKSIEFNIGVVVAFRILPKEVYSIPHLGMFNLHGSLLPKYRGAAPIQWALINGEKETGLTTFLLQEKVDVGNIILQEKISIDEDDNFESLHDKMASVGSELIIKTLDMISKGDVSVQVQDNSKASSAPKITKEICKIRWDSSAESIHNLIRGLSPNPAAYTLIEEKAFKIFKSSLTDNLSDSKPGTIELKNQKIYVNTADKKIILEEVQLEGKKRIKAEDFIRGFRFKTKSFST